jgi:Kef-type K+ transport system membrane component KefB
LLLSHRDPATSTARLSSFILIVSPSAVVAARARPPRLLALMRQHLHSSAQLLVRVSVLIVLLLVYLAYELGLDVLLGACAAG